MDARRLVAALSLIAALDPASARAQASADISVAAERRDSARVLHDARAAQATFERVRYRFLPWAPEHAGGTGDGTCDEVIGRFCMWDDGTDRDWQAPPEVDAVQAARAALIETLGRAAAASPGDGWIAGQRVRYLVEAHRDADALRAARECRAERWWCAALEGYALHTAGDFVAAGRAFDTALALLPADVAREWSALSPAVEDDDARALQRLPAAARDSALRRLWWLADPFWMDAGNDRRTEHFARLVADRLQDRARNTEGIFWADDLTEILLRWGQPTGWEKLRPRIGDTWPSGMVTHYANSYEFLPTAAMVRDPLAIRAGDWRMDGRRIHSRYSPPGVHRLVAMQQQAAVFRRGGRAEVVAAFSIRGDSLPPSPRLDAGLVLMRDPAAEPVVTRATVAGTRGVLRAAAAPEAMVLSLEAREPASRTAARARFGIDLRRAAGTGFGVSDLLLLDPPGARPASLDAAAPLARPGTTFHPGERIGLFWEVYGLAPAADSVTFSVALAEHTAGGARGRTPVRLRWTEAAAPGDILPRSLGIGLPPRVAPGAYRLELTVRTRSGQVSTAREITIIR